MLSDQLLAFAPIGRDVPPNPVGARHQYVDEVVDDDRDLDTINRLQLDRPIVVHRPLTLQRVG